MGPPKAIHRNRISPKQDSVKPTAIRTRPMDGACFCIRRPPSRCAGSWRTHSRRRDGRAETGYGALDLLADELLQRLLRRLPWLVRGRGLLRVVGVSRGACLARHHVLELRAARGEVDAAEGPVAVGGVEHQVA